MAATTAPPNEPPAPGPKPVPPSPAPPPPKPPVNEFDKYRKIMHKLIDVIFDKLQDPSFWIIS